jgi:hypothetical protein
MADLSKVIGFEWDDGNARKNEQVDGSPYNPYRGV